MYSHFNQILSKNQFRFRQSLSNQQSLLLMVEKLTESLDNIGVGGILLTYKKHLAVWDMIY